jgi:hypothetical protein
MSATVEKLVNSENATAPRTSRWFQRTPKPSLQSLRNWLASKRLVRTPAYPRWREHTTLPTVQTATAAAREIWNGMIDKHIQS